MESHVIISKHDYNKRMREAWLKGAAIALLVGIWVGYWWRMAQMVR